MPFALSSSGLVDLIPSSALSEFNCTGLCNWNEVDGGIRASQITGDTNNYATHTHNVTVANGHVLHIWHKFENNDPANASVMYARIGSEEVITHGDAAGSSEDWHMLKGTITGSGSLAPSVRFHIVVNSHWYYGFFKRIVIAKSNYVRLEGLGNYGNRVDLYRASDDAFLGSGQAFTGYVELSIEDEDFPEDLYFKVYAGAAGPLIQTSQDFEMCGGDIYTFTFPETEIIASTDVPIIIRQLGSGSPKTANFTAKLLIDDVPAEGCTVQFTGTLGTCNPTSDVTDEDGEAHTQFTSEIHGVGVVKTEFEGLDGMPAASDYFTIHIFYTEEVGDSDKAFQVYVEGYPVSYVGGEYALGYDNELQGFDVEIPVWDSNIKPRGLVSIYRLGSKEYSGILIKPRLAMGTVSPRLSGTDLKTMLAAETVVGESYTLETLENIVGDLLTTYPCGGITKGTIGSYEDITIDLTDQSLLTAMKRLADYVGWHLRVNGDLTLDLDASFGEEKANIIFAQGSRLYTATKSLNYALVANRIRVRGAYDLVSEAEDEDSIAEIGPVSDVTFQKAITDASLLDTFAAAEVARRVGLAVEVTAECYDDYDAGSWGIGDSVTLTSSDCELSGTYQIIRIHRNLRDPYYAEIEAVNEFAGRVADLMTAISQQLQNLNAKEEV